VLNVRGTINQSGVTVKGHIEGGAHTPGPWSIDHQRLGPPGDPVALLCDVNDRLASTVIDWPRGNDSGPAMSINDAENEANARLIAAAPELLAALSVALTADECPCCGRDNTGHDRCTSDDCPGVQAIAKATGVGTEEEL